MKKFLIQTEVEISIEVFAHDEDDARAASERIIENGMPEDAFLDGFNETIDCNGAKINNMSAHPAENADCSVIGVRCDTCGYEDDECECKEEIADNAKDNS